MSISREETLDKPSTSDLSEFYITLSDELSKVSRADMEGYLERVATAHPRTRT